MTEFYRGPGAHITHKVFESLTPSHHSYAIQELRYVHQLRSTPADAAMGSASTTVGAGLIAGAAALVALLGSSALDSPFTTVVALMVLLPVSVLFLQSWRIRRRPNTLWAVYRGERIRLFETRDRLVFDQVRRALLRALESAHEARI